MINMFLKLSEKNWEQNTQQNVCIKNLEKMNILIMFLM